MKEDSRTLLYLHVEIDNDIICLSNSWEENIHLEYLIIHYIECVTTFGIKLP